MKKLLILFLSLSVCSLTSRAQLLKKLADKVKDKSEQRADQKVDQTIDKGLDKADDATKKKNNSTDKKEDQSKDQQDKNNVLTSQPPLRVYANYDFVPGDNVLFEDNFTDDQDGEFPSHWELEKGQGLLNKINNEPAFFLTEGNYVQVYPRMKTKNYLSDPFTIEFDYYPQGGSYGTMVFFKHNEGDYDKEASVHFNEHGTVSTGYFPKDFSKDFPNEDDATFFNKWHHCAIIFKNNQMKCYVDQNRVLVIPSVDFKPLSVGFGGIGDEQHPIVFKNVRIAAGGNMNMTGKKFTESKIVTHGINFDIDKATIKPESMGTLNMIVKVMTDNPDVKFEIDGHTDNTGNAQHNLALSQQRADAVKDQLVKMGIDTSRLTTKGFGDTQPIDKNDTPEGKANNRRVEFVKM